MRGPAAAGRRTGAGATRRLTERVLRRAGSGAAPTTVVVLAAWDVDRTERCLAELSTTWPGPHRVVVVLNRPQARPRHVPDGVTLMAGSNRDGEFSAYDEGVAEHRRTGASPAAWLLVNDRMDSYDDQYRLLLDPATARFVVEEQAAVGWLDRLPRPFTARGHRVDVYGRSNYLMLPGALLDRLQAVTSVRRHEWPDEQGADDAASVLPGLPADYVRFLIDWHTGADPAGLGQWYRSGDPAATAWPALRRKLQAVVNEHLLSARLLEAGGVLVGPRQAALLARAAQTSGARRRALRRFRADPSASCRAHHDEARGLGVAVQVALLPGARHRRASAWS